MPADYPAPEFDSQIMRTMASASPPSTGERGRFTDDCFGPFYPSFRAGLAVAAHAAQKAFGTIEKAGIRPPRAWPEMVRLRRRPVRAMSSCLRTAEGGDPEKAQCRSC